MCTHTPTHAHTHTNTHAHIHTNTHAHTHTHQHTHTHAHTPVEVEDLRHLANTLSTIAQEKQKMAKAAKAKKKGTKSLNAGKGVRKQLGGALGDEFDDYSITDAGGKQLMDEDYDFM